jgi:hypothetical protein
MKKLSFLILVAILNVYLGYSTTYYIAPYGNDGNSGTSTSAPFATLQRANSVVSPGDVVYIRGGEYYFTNSNLIYTNANGTTVSESSALYASPTKLTTSGSSGALIKYYNYPHEQPVFNYIGVTKQMRITGILVTASYIVLKGIEMIHVPVNLAISHTQSECIRNFGNNNKYERIVMHDCEAIGFYLVKGANNLVLNCDAYRICDITSGNGLGENSDGFGCHPRAGGTGNVFKGCRAWFCADDGFDCIYAFEAVTFEECWAFYNGYSPSFAARANGNGFKSGGYGLTPTRLPAPIPRHVTKRCLAVGNRASGFYANHHPGGTNWYNNTAYDNGVNYNMLGGTISGSNGAYFITDCPGYNININNNISHYSPNSNTHIHSSGTALANLNYGASNEGYNTFTMNSVYVSDADFQSLDLSQLTAARNSTYGYLPEISCLHLTGNSDLVGAGVVVSGVSYTGSKPDLGCFETSSYKSATLLSRDINSANQVALYPNPVETTLNLSGVEENSLTEVYDISGSKVMETRETRIDLSQIKPGIYCIRNNSRTLKFIKK